MSLYQQRSLYFISFIIALFAFNCSIAAPSWTQWLSEFKQEAMSDGIDDGFFDSVFADVRPNKRVVNLDRSQPERRLTYSKYKKTRADRFRVNLGKKKYKKYRNLLEEVGVKYGVDPAIIVSLWGIESSYGHYMGKHSVIKALATLAYDKRRGKFFRKELLLALHILQDGHIDKKKFVGEWAGGTGQPQFLPSSWKQFAVDHNNDGKKDIWTDKADVFASIANYLVQNGWQRNQPWAIEVSAPDSFDYHLNTGYSVKKKVSEWMAMGIKPAKGFKMPKQDLEAYVLKPYGGPYIMAFHNFRVIMRYNRSTFYAGTVSYMADEIKKAIH